MIHAQKWCFNRFDNLFFFKNGKLVKRDAKNRGPKSPQTSTHLHQIEHDDGIPINHTLKLSASRRLAGRSTVHTSMQVFQTTPLVNIGYSTTNADMCQ